MIKLIQALATILLLGATSVHAQAPKPQAPAPQAPTPQTPITPQAVSTQVPPGQEAFASPQAAADALIDAVRRKDEALKRKLLGDAYRDLLPEEGVPEDVRKKFLDAWEAGIKVRPEVDGKVLIEVGTGGWTFPIPLVKRDDGWRFDIVAGAEEMGVREIGRNELSVIQTLMAIVDAQEEYTELDPMKNGGQYARRLLSSPDKKDGLYWPTREGEPKSPMGEFVARAQIDGTNRDTGYHGYRYRLLYSQGPNAKGGAREYLVNGRMIGGFGVIAWPVDHGETGNMTFIVNQDGDVFEKNLGDNTEAEAAKIKVFDPDKSWKKSDTKP